MQPLSIIIPAHNEESSIGRLLTTLLTPDLGPAQVIIAANGCSDATASIARRFDVEVLETEESSKTVALNAAELQARYFPRVFIDADVLLSGSSARRIADALSENSTARIAGPRRVLDLKHSSRLVALYYRGSAVASYGDQPFAGTGVFALSEEGRARFDRFPPVIADDTFVRALFTASEQLEVVGATVEVRAPSTLLALYRRSLRVRQGNAQLDLLDLPSRRREPVGRLPKSVIRHLLRHPRDATAVVVFLVITMAGRVRTPPAPDLDGWNTLRQR